MGQLLLTDNKFNSNPYWEIPLKQTMPLSPWHTDLYDQNGYDLTLVEELYAHANSAAPHLHRTHRKAIRQPWFVESTYKRSGSVLNHSLLFERKAFRGKAREQLQNWAEIFPVYHKHLNQKAKWGLDFSMDFYDKQGRTFEVLHWEFDSFEYDEIVEKKATVESILQEVDWDDAAEHIWKHKEDWYNLDFFAQSDYKCKYFGIGSERWKMVVW